MAITLYPPLGSSSSNAMYVQLDGNQLDAFGRLRVSNPYTIFDSQARFAADPAYSYAVSGSGATAYQTNKSSVNLTVGTAVGKALAQTFRVFPYQPGKSLLTLQTFTMAAAQSNLVQQVGYFSAQNGIYLQQSGTGASAVSLNVRTYTSGSIVDTSVTQPNWNFDKFDGTGPSGITLDLTKTQIFWIDIEWLGVGSVRAGFVINGIFYTAHQFNNANVQTLVYMTTAILPLRYYIEATGTVTGTPSLQMICSSVNSEGGYEQVGQPFFASKGTDTTVTTSYVPIVSIRINSSYPGAIVIPASVNFLSTATGSNYYTLALVKNATLTGATWASTMASGQVDVDTAATAVTAPTADQIVQLDYVASSNQAKGSLAAPTGYNYDLQLGYAASLSNANGFASTSDTYTLCAKVQSGSATGIGFIQFWDLTV